MYYTYVIRNPKGILYKGSTDNVEKRLDEHNFGKYSGYTKGKGPWECIYTEVFKTRSEAENREMFFKTGKGRDFLKEQIRKQEK